MQIIKIKKWIRGNRVCGERNMYTEFLFGVLKILEIDNGNGYQAL